MRTMEKGMMKVLIWGMLKDGVFQELSFKMMGEREREFEEGRLQWDEKEAIWEGKQEQLRLKVLFKCK